MAVKEKESGPVVLLALVISPFVMAMHGWFLSILWRWFVVNQFHVAPLRVPVAIGISCVVSMFGTSHQEDNRGSLERTFTSVIASLLVLFIGWVTTWFL